MGKMVRVSSGGAADAAPPCFIPAPFSVARGALSRQSFYTEYETKFKIYLQNFFYKIQNLFAKFFLQMRATLRDEYNDPNSTIIDYNDATVTNL